MSALGTYLKELRERKGVLKPPTLQDVSTKTNISISTLSALESGNVGSPRAEHLGELAKYYGVPVQELIDKIGA